jgi:hypothetical protein
MRYLAGILIALLLATPAFSVELFRYRGEDVPKAVTEKKLAEIAVDFMTSYYGIQVGALERAKFSKRAPEALKSSRLLLLYSLLQTIENGFQMSFHSFGRHS